MKAKENIPENFPGLSRKNPFGVPDNYFDEFPSRIQERMSASQALPVPWLYDVRRGLAMAAVFIGLVTVGYLGLRMILKRQDTTTLTGEELSVAIEYFGEQLDDDMLMAAIIESDIDLNAQDIDNETAVIIEFLSSEEIYIDEILTDY